MKVRLVVLATFLAVVSSSAPAAEPVENCGGAVRAEWSKDGRTMTLLEDFVYVDPAGVEWKAPKGSQVNGASIPQFLWSVMGGPYEGKYRNASVVHDVECDVKKRDWLSVHRMFYGAMTCSGVEELQAKVMYWAVYQCGPRWGKNVPLRPVPCGDGPKMTSYLAQLSRVLLMMRVSATISKSADDEMTLEKVEGITPEWLEARQQKSHLATVQEPGKEDGFRIEAINTHDDILHAAPAEAIDIESEEPAPAPAPPPPPADQ